MAPPSHTSGKHLFCSNNTHSPSSQGDLRAHGRTLLLFTTSAQTHIFPEIRIDSIRFIDILLEQLPESTIDGWSNATSHGGMVLLGYLGLLNAGTTYDHNHGRLVLHIQYTQSLEAV